MNVVAMLFELFYVLNGRAEHRRAAQRKPENGMGKAKEQQQQQPKKNETNPNI